MFDEMSFYAQLDLFKHTGTYVHCKIMIDFIVVHMKLSEIGSDFDKKTLISLKLMEGVLGQEIFVVILQLCQTLPSTLQVGLSVDS